MKRSAAKSRLTDQLAALSDVLRLRMCRLLEAQELTVSEICKVFQTPQSTASRHLRVLSDAGWLAKRADGTATFYRLTAHDPGHTNGALWAAVSGNGVELRDTFEQDRRRMEGVLSQRRTDGLAFFGRVAGGWDHLRTELFGGGFALHALPAFLPSEWIVADLGCGTGSNAEIIARFVRQVICIDQSQPMLEAARKRLQQVENVRFAQGPLEALPLADDAADAALCVLVLHYLDNPLDGLSEVRRVVRPGGRVLIVDMFEHTRSEYRNTMGHRHLGFKPEQICAWLEEAGFDATRVTALPAEPDAKGPGLFVATGG